MADQSASITAMILSTHSPGTTEALGQALGRLLRSGDVVALAGNLGAGKTCLVRGAAYGWGAVENATSPTFTLINEYHRPSGDVMAHVDCYRMSGVGDAWSSGIEDVLSGRAVVLIEWPERIAEILAGVCLWIDIQDLGDTSRRLTLTARTPRGQEIVAALRSTALSGSAPTPA